MPKTDRRHKRSGWFCLWFDWYYLCCYFAVGCSICGAVESSSTKTSYTCYGCVGGSCLVSSDVNDAADSLNDLSNALNDLSDAYN